MLKLKPLDLI